MDNHETRTAPMAGGPSSPVVLGGMNRQGDTLLCYACGETGRPSVMVARTRDDVRRFIVTEWLGVEDAIDADFQPELPKIMARLDAHDWHDGALEWEFEIGGVRIEDVFSTVSELRNDRCGHCGSRYVLTTSNDRVEGRDACGASLWHAGLAGTGDKDD